MIKRIFDFVISGLILLVLMPAILLIAFFVAKNIGYPVFFCQKRPGLNGKIFTMFKFRTMRDCFDSHGNLLPDSERMTLFGNKLRSWSLDELPGLWNVLKGDMSLVGPRPLLVEYLPLYNTDQARRHDVRPGITGWAQINGRNAISWQDKFNLDIWYVENQSFRLDVKILFLTVKKVFIKEGITASGHVTIEPFKGNRHD